MPNLAQMIVQEEKRSREMGDESENPLHAVQKSLGKLERVSACFSHGPLAVPAPGVWHPFLVSRSSSLI